MMMINTAIEFNNEAARLHNENKFGEALGKLRNAMNSIEGSSLSLDNSAKIEAPKSPLHYNQHLYYKYDEGTRVFTKLLTLCSDDRHKTDYVEAVIAYNLGICYSLQNEFDLASEYFLDVHCVLCSRKFNHTESYIKLQSSLVHINEGHNFFRQGNYEEALASYWDAVNQAKHEGKTNDLIIGAAMNCIGVTVLTQVLKESHSDKLNIKVLAPLNSALAIFVDHCGDAKAAGPRSKLYMSTIVNNIGRARFYAGDYEGALPFFTKAYLVRESLCDEGDVNVAISSLFVGLCLRKIGDTQGAMDQFNRYISIMLKSRNLAYLGDSIEQIMHLASLFQKDGHDPIAIAFLNIALKCASRQEDGEDLKNSSLQNTIRSKMKTLCSQKAALKLLS